MKQLKKYLTEKTISISTESFYLKNFKKYFELHSNGKSLFPNRKLGTIYSSSLKIWEKIPLKLNYDYTF